MFVDTVHSITVAKPGEVIAAHQDHEFASRVRVLVGDRSADRMLAHVGRTGVSRMTAPELAAVGRVPLRIAERIVAARELSQACTDPGPIVGSSKDVLLHLPRGYAQLETEHLLGIALSSQNRMKAMVLLAKGGSVGTSVNLRDILVPMVRFSACSFILVHNHPGGSCQPSREDVELTNAAARAGRAVGIELVDHLVVASGGVVSFYDTGLLPTREECEALARSAEPARMP